MSDNLEIEIPPKVSLSIKLLYFNICIGIIRAFIVVVRHWEVRTPDIFILVKILLVAVLIFLIFFTRKGKNWARLTLVAFLSIAIPLSILPMFSSLTHNPIPNLLGLVQAILFVWAIVLLFHSTSAAWFKKGTPR
jgi:hypothetical protein